MSNCREKSMGTVVDSTTGVTNVPLDSNDYSMITVFNESDGTIVVDYKTSVGTSGFFLVPAGFSFTRKASAKFINGSVKVYGNNGDVIGPITINFGS